MFCGKCGKEVPDGAVACPACGAPTGAPTDTAPTPPPQRAPTPPKAPVSKGKIIGLSILGVIALLIIAGIVWAFIPNDKTRIEDELYRIMEEEYHANTDLFTVEKIAQFAEIESDELDGVLYAFTIRTCGGDLQSGMMSIEVSKEKDKKNKERTFDLVEMPALFYQIKDLGLK